MRNFLTVARAALAMSISGLLCCVAANAAAPQASSSINLEALNKILGAQKSQAAAARGLTLSKSDSIVAAPGTTKASESFENPYRAYPPSCLNSPIQFGMWANDPGALQAQITLPGDPLSPVAGERTYTEPVVVTVFRVTCTSGLAATLIEFDRTSTGGTNGYYPVVPSITVTQGSASDVAVRMADDPNTFFSTVYAATPLYASDVFVLENFYNPQSFQFNYNQAFTLTVDSLIPNTDAVPYAMQAYAPPASPAPLPISGYLSSAYYDAAHSGEGLMVEIYDNGDLTTRTFFAAWYTFDPLGLPFWLSAQISFPIVNSGGQLINGLQNVPTFYVTNGGFAGNFGAKATANNWGTMNFSFPDCNTIVFSYTGNTGSVQGPSGSGTRTWKRLANINSLSCK
jgi:hypothetical protein